jgi:CHAT domain-containing protein/Tfp pilus assembly protein PilF
MSASRAVLAVCLVTCFSKAPAADDGLTVAEANKLRKEAYDSAAAGDWLKALANFERVVDNAPRLVGEGTLDHATLLVEVGTAYNRLGKHEKARVALEQCLKIREARLGDEDMIVAKTLEELGAAHRGMGQYSQAETLFRRMLKIAEKKQGEDPLTVAAALNGLAVLLDDMGKHTEAETLYQRSLSIREAELGPTHTLVGSTLSNMAVLYAHMADRRRAAELLERSVSIIEANHGKDSVHLVVPILNLAANYQALGQYDNAVPAFQRCISIAEAKFGPRHPNLADAVNQLGLTYYLTKEYAKAEPLYKRALAIREAALGADHPQVADSLANLGVLYQVMRQPKQALPLFERSLKIHEERLGPDHPGVALDLHNLATLHAALGEYAKAETLYTRSLRIREDKLGKYHPDVAASLDNIIALYLCQERFEDAARRADQMRRISRRHIGNVLPALSEKEQLRFLRTLDQPQFDRVQSLGFEVVGDKSLATLSAAWVINGKGMAQETLAERAMLVRDSSRPETMQAAREVIQVRRELATLALATFDVKQVTARQAQLARLNAREQELSRKLSQLAGRPPQKGTWVEIDEVRRVLPADSVLVEISRFHLEKSIKEGKVLNKGLHYAAWIVPPAGSGEVRLIDLGDASLIERRVEVVRQTLRDAPALIRKEGEAEGEKVAQQALQGLSKLILEPLLPHIIGAKQWIISPDAQLWLVPWTALQLKDSRYAVEEHEISYALSGRDLLAPGSKAAVNRPLVFADPDYDLSASEAVRQTQETLRGLGVAPVVSLAGQRLRGSIGNWNVSFSFVDNGTVKIHDEDKGGKVAGEGRWSLEGSRLTMQTAVAQYTGKVDGTVVGGERVTGEVREHWQFLLPISSAPTAKELAEFRSVASSAELLPKVVRLPGTSAEAQAIAPSIRSYTRAEPQIYTDKRAVEGVFRAARSPRLIVLSTHGFFLPEQSTQRDERRCLGPDMVSTNIPLSTDGRPLENPLVRCGVLLAGCNERSKTEKTGGDDGILTGLEIVGADLRGTELVVLSACETGLGDVRNGEGVAGLRQAFQLAGAQSVVATLWQISDRDSAILMNDFFAQLAKVQRKAEALREAQVSRIKSRRERNGAAHPFFWAAFTLTGK